MRGTRAGRHDPRYAQHVDPEEDEAAREARMARVRAEQALQRWYSNKMTVMGVTFPIYAARAGLYGSTDKDPAVTISPT